MGRDGHLGPAFYAGGFLAGDSEPSDRIEERLSGRICSARSILRMRWCGCAYRELCPWLSTRILVAR
jgi:hypothetical protein